MAELVARLVGAGFLGIVGRRGRRKVVVLRAGLLPALAAGVLPGSEGWRRLLLRPGERPLDELRRVLVSGAKDPLAEALDALPANGRLLLAVDQFEELFTACRSTPSVPPSPTHSPARPLIRRVEQSSWLHSVPTFYGRFAAYAGLAELLGANHVLVGPMQASELRRAVELPAGRVGLQVERELAEGLVDDTEGEPGALPLLSTALLELWQKAGRQRPHTDRLPRVRGRTRRRRAAGRRHLRSNPRRAQAARARRHAAPGGRGRRAGAPPRSARRARPGAQRRRGRRARDAGRQPSRHRVGRKRRGRP